jgi:hypothetical protein
VKSWVDDAKANRTWLILVFHNIATDVSQYPYGTTPTTLQEIVSYVNAQHIAVHDMAQGIELMKAPAPDTTAPVITLNGNATMELHVGETYTEQGATALDNADTSVNVVIGGDTVNTATTSVSHVTYDAIDHAGNHATQVVRTVTVVAAPTPDATSSPETTTPPSSNSGGSSSHRGGGGGSKRSTSTKTIVTASSTSPVQNIVLASSATSTGVVPIRMFTFNTNLRLGMQHRDVVELQNRLKQEGFFTYPTATGYFGRITFDAVRAYQKAHLGTNLMTGFVGPLTRAALNK